MNSKSSIGLGTERSAGETTKQGGPTGLLQVLVYRLTHRVGICSPGGGQERRGPKQARPGAGGVPGSGRRGLRLGRSEAGAGGQWACWAPASEAGFSPGQVSGSPSGSSAERLERGTPHKVMGP